MLSEENRKKKYKECCKIKRSLVEYNKNAASESNKIIKEIFLAKGNKTIIFVSHNLDNLTYCDLIYEVRERTLFQKN